MDIAQEIISLRSELDSLTVQIYYVPDIETHNSMLTRLREVRRQLKAMENANAPK